MSHRMFNPLGTPPMAAAPTVKTSEPRVLAADRMRSRIAARLGMPADASGAEVLAEIDARLKPNPAPKLTAEAAAAESTALALLAWSEGESADVGGSLGDREMDDLYAQAWGA